MTRLVLASGSPRRRELMALLGRPFEVRVADVDETVGPDESAAEAVERLARRKAEAVDAADPGAITVGADTEVVLDGRVLGKPAVDADAVAMLRALSGRTHEVLTGVAIVGPDGTTTSFVSRTDVTFVELTDRQIDAYVSTGEPLDKAGAYGIQGSAGAFVSEIRGSYHNVVGLPVAQLAQALDGIGRAQGLAGHNS